VWLYDRFCLGYRDVEELLLAREVTSSQGVVRLTYSVVCARGKV
jgi:hypothetical protein